MDIFPNQASSVYAAGQMGRARPQRGAGGRAGAVVAEAWEGVVLYHLFVDFW